MSVTLTGAVLLLVGLYFIATRPHRLVLALVFFASFSGTSVFNFSSFGVSPGVLFFGLYLAWGLASGNLGRPVLLGRNHPAVVLCLVVFSFYVLGAMLLNGAGQGLASLQVTQTVYLFMGVAIAATLSFEISRDQMLERSVTALRLAACFIAGWGILQAVCFYSGVDYPAFLFNNSTSHFADMFDQRAGEGVIRLASVAVEPSFMASSLMIFGAFGATVVVCEPRLQTARWVVPVALALLVVAAATSTTGFFGLAVLGVLLLLRRPGLMVAAGLGVVLLAAVALVLLPGFREAVYGMTLGKSESSSYTERTASLVAAMASFTDRPWFGGGWGTDFSYSMVTNMLANVGLVGCLLFGTAVAGTLLTSRSVRHQTRGDGQWRLRAYAMGAETAMVVYFAQAAVSGFKYVVPDFWVLWALCLAIPSTMLRGASRTDQAAIPLGRPTGFAQAPRALEDQFS